VNGARGGKRKQTAESRKQTAVNCGVQEAGFRVQGSGTTSEYGSLRLSSF
jgi:hypothetical protein